MRKFFGLFMALTLIAALALPFASVSADDHESTSSIVDIAAGDARFSTLVAAVEAAGLAETLDSGGPFTVFAPTNDAFAAVLGLLDISAADLLADTDLLTDILLYHVVPGRVYAEDVVGLDSATALNGEDIAIGSGPLGVALNGTANVVITDIEASNGVIHVIDAVIFPPQNVVGLVRDNNLSILFSAIETAGLTEALLGEGPFTIFAPTNEAFAAALDALGITADDLFANTDLLTEILLYHVVPGEVTAEQVVQLNSAATLNGASVGIDASMGYVNLNDGQAQVVVADIMGRNGVVHIINGVLLPPQ